MGKPKFIGFSLTNIEATFEQNGVTRSKSSSATSTMIAKTADAARDKASKLSQTIAQKLVNGIPGPTGITKNTVSQLRFLPSTIQSQPVGIGKQATLSTTDTDAIDNIYVHSFLHVTGTSPGYLVVNSTDSAGTFGVTVLTDNVAWGITTYIYLIQGVPPGSIVTTYTLTTQVITYPTE